MKRRARAAIVRRVFEGALVLGTIQGCGEAPSSISPDDDVSICEDQVCCPDGATLEAGACTVAPESVEVCPAATTPGSDQTCMVEPLLTYACPSGSTPTGEVCAVPSMPAGECPSGSTTLPNGTCAVPRTTGFNCPDGTAVEPATGFCIEVNPERHPCPLGTIELYDPATSGGTGVVCVDPTANACPSGSYFDGSACVGSASCPSGTSWNGSACVGEMMCPSGAFPIESTCYVSASGSSFQCGPDSSALGSDYCTQICPAGSTYDGGSACYGSASGSGSGACPSGWMSGGSACYVYSTCPVGTHAEGSACRIDCSGSGSGSGCSSGSGLVDVGSGECPAGSTYWTSGYCISSATGCEVSGPSGQCLLPVLPCPAGMEPTASGLCGYASLDPVVCMASGSAMQLSATSAAGGIGWECVHPREIGFVCPANSVDTGDHCVLVDTGAAPAMCPPGSYVYGTLCAVAMIVVDRECPAGATPDGDACLVSTQIELQCPATSTASGDACTVPAVACPCDES